LNFLGIESRMDNVKVLIIYGYAKNGKMTYVGQTHRPLKCRDAEHRSGKKTVFDRDYKSNCKDYSLPVELSRMVCTNVFSSDTEELMARHEWQIWMDKEETYWIKYYNTYGNGLNQTRGGQTTTRGVAFFQSNAKKQLAVWTNKYMPLLRTMAYYLSKRLWEVPKQYVISGWQVGTFFDNLRQEHTLIPGSFRQELRDFGFDVNKTVYESKFEHDYMPAFRRCLYGRTNQMWETPQNFKSKDGDVPLGRILDNIRTGNNYIPNTYIMEMTALGFDRNKSYEESRWEIDIFPALRACPFADRLWAVPIGAIQYKIKIGDILHNFRRKGMKNKKNQGILDILNTMGFKNGSRIADDLGDQKGIKRKR
jgi:hypothetical protein